VIFTVITFPGSNCDRDCLYAIGDVLGFGVKNVFHKQSEIGPTDAVVIPGGFSYGDYLRCGALAKLSPIMRDVRRFAERGGLVIGICNGFQILCEAGLLPGALIRNRSLRFVSRVVEMRVENNRTPFTSQYVEGQIISMPIAHGEGCYVADEHTIQELETGGRVMLRYSGPMRVGQTEGNPNGSTNAIAGITNETGNVFGLMPHPERATDPSVDGTDGAGIFRSMAEHILHKASAISVSVNAS
jgi:phosphoribosylformylglycinamidine synthase subunit PurQ / glutaminase